MKTIILPFSCIKAHYEGDVFTPVEVAAGVWELQSATRVLGGSNGNLYHFTSAANAALWVDSNLIRASKQKTTRIQMIAQLQAKHAANPQPWLAEEIAVLEARNAGEWGIVLGEPITGDWEIYPQGVSGDANNALILGTDGKPFYEPAPQGGGVVYSEWLEVSNKSVGLQVMSVPHGLGVMPDNVELRIRLDVELGGWPIKSIIMPDQNLSPNRYTIGFNEVNIITSFLNPSNTTGMNSGNWAYINSRLAASVVGIARSQLTFFARAYKSLN